MSIHFMEVSTENSTCAFNNITLVALAVCVDTLSMIVGIVG